MITGIILMAGEGRRLNLGYNKTLSLLDKKMMYQYTLDKFIQIGLKNIILVVNESFYEKIKEKEEDVNVLVIKGGKTRQESVYNALQFVKTDKVLIHDAARPYLSIDDLISFIKELDKKDALILAEKMTDTVKMINNNQMITINRNNLLKATTPQGFKTEKILKAHNLGINEEATDDAYLYEKYIDKNISYIIASRNNNKITTPLDIKSEYKIGHSFDLHRLVENRKLILGGIEIPYHLGLLGHSDADCLLHAITEAMLGIIGKYDLGELFPDNKDEFKDISSVKLLKIVKDIFKQDFEIANIDCMIYLEEPKIYPFKKKIKENIADILNIDLNQISVKATTLEKFQLTEHNNISAECFILGKIKI